MQLFFPFGTPQIEGTSNRCAAKFLTRFSRFVNDVEIRREALVSALREPDGGGADRVEHGVERVEKLKELAIDLFELRCAIRSRFGKHGLRGRTENHFIDRRLRPLRAWIIGSKFGDGTVIVEHDAHRHVSAGGIDIDQVFAVRQFSGIVDDALFDIAGAHRKGAESGVIEPVSDREPVPAFADDGNGRYPLQHGVKRSDEHPGAAGTRHPHPQGVHSSAHAVSGRRNPIIGQTIPRR